MSLVSPAVKAENARLRAFLETLNRQSQERPPQPKQEPRECSICRGVHGTEIRHACE